MNPKRLDETLVQLIKQEIATMNGELDCCLSKINEIGKAIKDKSKEIYKPLEEK